MATNDHFYQVTITKGTINEKGEKENIEVLTDTITRLPDEKAISTKAQASLKNAI